MAIIVASSTSSPRSILAFAASATGVLLLDRLAQDVAGRDLRQTPLAREPRRLRAFAGTRRPHHDDVQAHTPVYPRRPRIRVFFMNPS